jgi:hypothetical protein
MPIFKVTINYNYEFIFSDSLAAAKFAETALLHSEEELSIRIDYLVKEKED